MQGVYILSAVRTPIGKFGGSLASMTAADMGMVAAKAAMERAGVRPEQVEETIFGNARQAGGGPNPARQISIRSGVPQEVPAYTVNKACASGIKSIALAFTEIAAGNLECVLAGGTESMSRVPYYLDGARWGYRLGDQELVDGMYRDGFFCPMAKMVMGETAEVLAEQHKITREEQDEFALDLTDKRPPQPLRPGSSPREIVPVTLESKKGPQIFDKDEHPFVGATMEKLAKLAPVFSKTGTVTAGNSSGITDGAAAVIVASQGFVKKHNLKPLVRISAVTSAGVDPRTMGIGPVPALNKMEQKHGLRVSDFDLIELNEAFAAQVHCLRPRVALRPLQAEREWRRHRARPSHRMHWNTHHGDAYPRNAEAQSEKRRGHPLRKWWYGHGSGPRKHGLERPSLTQRTILFWKVYLLCLSPQ